jgi:hypothetical protein
LVQTRRNRPDWDVDRATDGSRRELISLADVQEERCNSSVNPGPQVRHADALVVGGQIRKGTPAPGAGQRVHWRRCAGQRR